MWESIRKRRTWVLIALFLLSGLALTALERDQPVRQDGPFTAASMQAAGASQSTMYALTRGLSKRWTRHMYLVGVEEENQRLREELARTREERTRLLGVMQENARLRALVGFAETHPRFNLTPAKVISRDVNEFFRVLHVRRTPPPTRRDARKRPPPRTRRICGNQAPLQPHAHQSHFTRRQRVLSRTSRADRDQQRTYPPRYARRQQRRPCRPHRKRRRPLRTSAPDRRSTLFRTYRRPT